MDTSTRVILVGGAGFIGSELAKELASDANVSVTVVYIDDLAESEKVKNVEYKSLDFSKAGEETAAILQNADCAVLLARPDEALIKGFLSAANNSNLHKIVYTSTLLVYADSAARHDETSPPDPLTEYETQKFGEENLLKEFASQKTRVCIARLGNVYGGKKNRGIVGKMTNAIESGESFIINGDGEHTRDYIFVADVARALKKLILRGQKNVFEIYNVCSGKGYTINDLINEFETISCRVMKKENRGAILEKISVVGDNQKIKEAVDFEPKIGLREGLSETYKWCKI